MFNPIVYRCFDLVTMDTLDILPFQGVTFGETLNGDGPFSATLNLADPSMRNLDWERATRENASIVVCDIGGVAQWSGWIETRRWNQVSKTLTVSGSTFNTYFKQRLQAVDYSAPNPANQYWAANPCDPTVIAAQVLADSQIGTLTMPGGIGIGPIAGDGHGASLYGVQVLINGSPPPNIIGVSTTGWTINAFDVLYMKGINPGVVVGSTISGPNIATAGLTYVGQNSRTPTYTGTGTWTGTVNTISFHASTSAAPIKGQLVVGNGIPIGCTVTSVHRTAANTYNVGLTANTTVSHPGGTPVTITGFFVVSTGVNATGTSTSTGSTYSFSTAPSTAPTPTIQWVTASYPVSGLRTVDDIVSQLASMGYGAGFEYAYDVTYGTDNSTPIITLDISYPRRGNGGTSVSLYINAGQMIDFDYIEDSTSQAIGIAESANGASIQYVNEYQLVSTSGFAPLELAVSHSSINSQSVLDGLAQGDLATLSNPVVTATVSVPLGLPDDSGNYDASMVNLNQFITGDDVMITIDPAPIGTDGSPIFGPRNSERFPNGLRVQLRILQWAVTVPVAGIPVLKFALGVPPVGATTTTTQNLGSGASTLPVNETVGFAASGQANVSVGGVVYLMTYTSLTSTSFVGCTITGSVTVTVPQGSPVYPSPQPSAPLR